MDLHTLFQKKYHDRLLLSGPGDVTGLDIWTLEV